MSARSLLLAFALLACAPPVAPQRQPAETTLPEACEALAACCDTLAEPDNCRSEVSAGEASDTGGVRCSRALDDYRALGFCAAAGAGGNNVGQGPGCQALAACCQSLGDADARATCSAERTALVDADGAARDPTGVDDACGEAFDQHVAAGDCEAGAGAQPVVVDGPNCQALLACCATLSTAARASCEASVEQIGKLPDEESRCAASRAAYLEAGLCASATPPPSSAPACALVLPADDACCACPTGKSCAPNGCYNGYLCDPATCGCSAPPKTGPCATP